MSKHIIDQRIRKIVADNPDRFTGENDDKKKLSKAFVQIHPLDLKVRHFNRFTPVSRLNTVFFTTKVINLTSDFFSSANLRHFKLSHRHCEPRSSEAIRNYELPVIRN